MPIKRKQTKLPFKANKKRKYGAFSTPGSNVAVVRRIVKKALNKNIETKKSNFTVTDGIEIGHNGFVKLNANLLLTSQGTQDPNSGSGLNRIGDEINLKGVSIKMMVELNERYSDVTFRILIVKCAKGDSPERDTLFNNVSGNKMIDTINTERYTVIAQKWFKIKAPSPGTIGGVYPGAGYNAMNSNEQLISRATKIVKMWIPGKKFTRSGIIKYENGSSQPKFFDYQALIYAYSNYSTLQDPPVGYYVGRVNDYVQQTFFKDG